jgi:hypothetical protein
LPAVAAATAPSPTGASGAATLSEPDLVSQANAACKEANGKLQALMAPSDLSSVAAFADQASAIGTSLYGKLAAFTLPASLQEKYGRAWPTSNGLARVDEPKRAAAGDVTKVPSLVAQLRANQSGPEAKALGLTECAKQVQPQG